MGDAKKDPPADPNGGIPKAVVARLSLYLRELQQHIAANQATTSSRLLGRKLGFTDAQVRKDLAYFGHFGYPGIGYRCEELVQAIRAILGTDRRWPVAMIGAGNLGRALLGYKGFQQQGFEIVAAFDSDPRKVGDKIDTVTIYDLDRLPDLVREHRIRIGLISVPAASAQSAADQLVAAGVDGILNFAPVTLTLPAGIRKIGVDLAIQLEQLSFAVLNPDTPD
ncbi:MAG: redox-sensing transcriptional repressor Rex [Pirellulales bacterium]